MNFLVSLILAAIGGGALFVSGFAAARVEEMVAKVFLSIGAVLVLLSVMVR